MKKFANDRGTTAGFTHSEHDYERAGKCPDWLDRFARDFNNQTIVDKTRERNSQSLQDQINSIVNNAPIKTVDSVVQDMQERTGLKQYLMTINAQDKETKQNRLQAIANKLNDTIKQAENLPDLFKAIPETQSFVDNMARGSHGTLAIEAIVESLKECYDKNPNFEDKLAEDRSLKEYINKQLISHNNSTDHDDANIGSPDVSTNNTDNADNENFLANIGNV